MKGAVNIMLMKTVKTDIAKLTNAEKDILNYVDISKIMADASFPPVHSTRNQLHKTCQ